MILIFLSLVFTVRKPSRAYSQTGCSFLHNFADFCRDIGNLIGSLLRANCNRAGQSRRTNSSTKMFQVLVQYLGDRYASFYDYKAINDYHELLKRVTTMILYLKQLQAEQVRLAYKDLQLRSYINIDPAECLHMAEMRLAVVLICTEVWN